MVKAVIKQQLGYLVIVYEDRLKISKNKHKIVIVLKIDCTTNYTILRDNKQTYMKTETSIANSILL